MCSWNPVLNYIPGSLMFASDIITEFQRLFQMQILYWHFILRLLFFVLLILLNSYFIIINYSLVNSDGQPIYY